MIGPPAHHGLTNDRVRIFPLERSREERIKSRRLSSDGRRGIRQSSLNSHRRAFFWSFTYSGFQKLGMACPGAIKQTRPRPYS